MTQSIPDCAHSPGGILRADRALFDEFLHADRRGPHRPVLAVNSRLLIANSLAGDLINDVPNRHLTLWRQICASLDNGPSIFTIGRHTDGSSPIVASVRRLHTSEDGDVGAVLRLRVNSGDGEHETRTPHPPLGTHVLERVPGRSALWRRVVERSAAAACTNGRLLLVGPVGVGKSALAKALLGVNTTEVDTASQPSNGTLTNSDGTGPLIATHVERLDAQQLELLCDALGRRSSDPAIATYRTMGSIAEIPAVLAAQFEHVVEVPPLDAHLEDVPDIVRAILNDGDGLSVHVEPEAFRELMRRNWPGNVSQLRRTVLAALGPRDSGNRNIRKSDLPDLVRPAPPSRRLTRLELVERDAIAAALVAAGGNKRAAASDLGLSRSTLYRKISALGLDQ